MKNRISVFFRVVLLLAFMLALSGQAAPAPVSVIVQAADADQAAALVSAFGGQVTSRLEIIRGVGARLSPGALAALRQDGRAVVSANASAELTAHEFEAQGPRQPATDYADVTGADLVWQQGVTGSGVTVAVIDTGIAANHPALKKGLDGKNRDVIAGWVDFVEGSTKPVDPNGHGTHIAGIIADASLGTDNEYNGMAPGVSLLGVRVLDQDGAGDYEKVIQGIQWVIEHKDQYNVKVINLSLHALVQSPYWADPLDQAVMRAWAEGIAVVVAAGNDGPSPLSVAVPGNTPYAITVGAFTDNYTPTDWNDDYVAPFSAAGPTLDGFAKPDLVGPGAHITATMLPGSVIARQNEANRVGKQYFSMAGTSQAAAVVSGAAALVAAQNPGLTPDQIKYRLLMTAMPWVNTQGTDVLYSVWQQGAGRLNAYDAVFADIDGAANNGLDVWADLSGDTHFQGYSYYDETTGTYRLHGYENEASGYGTWAGGYGTWIGGYGTWIGGYGTWAGGYGTWIGGYGTWIGGYGTWAGGYGTWIGGYGTWIGGYGTWAGGYGTWIGGYGTWAGRYADPVFVTRFIEGVSPEVRTTTASIRWIPND